MARHRSFKAVSSCSTNHCCQPNPPRVLPLLPMILGAKGSSHDGHGVVVEDCWDIFRGELVGGITDEKTCLSDRTVADDDAPVGQ
jgi:hypothetical protein